MTNPFFSVIIPTLNEEKYLPTILASLARQTYRDFELIVVDGKSSDNTNKVFDKYKKNIPGSVYVKSDKNNVGYQRNIGGKNAQGDYLVFFDADVDIESTFLEEVHVAAVKKNFTLATTWISPDSKDSIDVFMMLLANLGVELAKGVGKPFAGGYNTIVKKQVFEKLRGFNDKIKIGEDYDFIIRAGKKGFELAILKEPKLMMSLRRLRSEGTLRILRKYAIANLHMLLKGPITESLFDYNMGGHAHVIKKKNKRFKDLRLQLPKIEKKFKELFN